MKLTFYGVRGSHPQTDQDMTRYGGDTTSLRIVSASGDEYMFDAGSGAIKLGKELMGQYRGQVRAKVFITHDHWDHIQGFPFFIPAYVPGCEVDVYSGDKKLAAKLVAQTRTSDTAFIKRSQLEKEIQGDTVVLNKGPERNHTKDVFAGQQNVEGGYFPVPISAMSSNLRFHDLKEDFVVQNGLSVSYRYFNEISHPGGMFSYKIQEGNKRIVFGGDYEHDGADYGIFGENDKRLIEWTEGADALVIDGQYTPEEYLKKKKWGHSQIERICEIAAQAHVKQLYITHHDPDHTDSKLDSMHEQAQRFMTHHLKQDIPVIFAKQKMEVTL